MSTYLIVATTILPEALVASLLIVKWGARGSRCLCCSKYCHAYRASVVVMGRNSKRGYGSEGVDDSRSDVYRWKALNTKRETCPALNPHWKDTKSATDSSRHLLRPGQSTLADGTPIRVKLG